MDADARHNGGARSTLAGVPLLLSAQGHSSSSSRSQPTPNTQHERTPHPLPVAGA